MEKSWKFQGEKCNFNLQNKRNDICCHFFYLNKLKNKTLKQTIICINHSIAFKECKYKNVICRTIWNKETTNL